MTINFRLTIALGGFIMGIALWFGVMLNCDPILLGMMIGFIR